MLLKYIIQKWESNSHKGFSIQNTDNIYEGKNKDQSKFNNKLSDMKATKLFNFIKIKYFSFRIQMDISNNFVDQLFANSHFKQSLENFFVHSQIRIPQPHFSIQHDQADSVIKEITEVLYENFKVAIQKECNFLYESNNQILEQIQSLKGKLQVSSKLKTQSSTAQRDTRSKLQTSIFFQADDQYDMNQLRKNTDDCQEEIENRILINSFELEQQQKTYIDPQIEQKINQSIQGNINRIQLSLQEKFQKYSVKIQQRIQQLKKTIASVVQAMNDRQSWQKSAPRTKNHQNNKNVSNHVFAKKQTKQNQNNIVPSQAKSHYIQIQKIHKISESKNQQKERNHEANTNSQKAMQSLNKSINLGRSKIKSLFGFSSKPTKQKNEDKNIQ